MSRRTAHRRRARARALVLAVQAFASVAILGWTTMAAAHPGYPPVMDQALGEPALFVENEFKPTGCQICHTSSAGGTALVSFGTLLVSTYGLSNDPINENDNSLKQAMIGLAAMDPDAVADLKKAIDPNSDPAVFATALPQPEYGCTTGSSTGRRPYPGLVVMIVTIGILFGWRRCTGARAKPIAVAR